MKIGNKLYFIYFFPFLFLFYIFKRSLQMFSFCLGTVNDFYWDFKNLYTLTDAHCW